MRFHVAALLSMAVFLVHLQEIATRETSRPPCLHNMAEFSEDDIQRAKDKTISRAGIMGEGKKERSSVVAIQLNSLPWWNILICTKFPLPRYVMFFII